MSQKIKITILMILTLMIINISSAYATNLTVDQFEQIYTTFSELELTPLQKNQVQEIIDEFEYTTIDVTNTGSEMRLLGSNTRPYTTSIASGTTALTFYMKNGEPGANTFVIHKTGDSTFRETNGAVFRVPTEMKELDDPNPFANFVYLPDGADNTLNDYIFFEGWTNLDITIKKYLQPYFQFAEKKIATTTLENFDGNIPCFYPNTFKTYSNSYATYKRIGYLYIDKDYNISQIYTSTPTINIYNMQQTQSWQYKNYLIFTDNIAEDGYIKYNINFDINYINSPYIYSMQLVPKNSELGEIINVDFLLLNSITEEERRR